MEGNKRKPAFGNCHSRGRADSVTFNSNITTGQSCCQDKSILCERGFLYCQCRLRYFPFLCYCQDKWTTIVWVSSTASSLFQRKMCTCFINRKLLLYNIFNSKLIYDPFLRAMVHVHTCFWVQKRKNLYFSSGETVVLFYDLKSLSVNFRQYLPEAVFPRFLFGKLFLTTDFLSFVRALGVLFVAKITPSNLLFDMLTRNLYYTQLKHPHL